MEAALGEFLNIGVCKSDPKVSVSCLVPVFRSVLQQYADTESSTVQGVWSRVVGWAPTFSL